MRFPRMRHHDKLLDEISPTSQSFCILTLARIIAQDAILSDSFHYHYKSTWDGLRSLVRDEGFFSLYKGLGASILGVSHVMIQFPIYEHMKTQISTSPEVPLTTLEILLCSSASKIIASTLTYPHEVLYF